VYHINPSGIALIQSLNVKRIKTFVDLAQDFIQCQLSCFSRVVCLVDVFDRYDLELSMKSAQRNRRSAPGLSRKVCQAIEGRPIPDWKKFLGVDTNKQALLQFLGKSIVEHHDQSPRKMSAEDTLFLAGVCNDPMTVKKICSEGVSDCPELFCTHEEADTRMLLYVIHTDRMFGEKRTKGRIIVKSPDTDVLVLCVHYIPSLQYTDELWFQTGAISSTKDERRFIPVHDILCNSIDPVICKILPAVHAVTGCDTTSSMFGIGKRTVFKVLKDRPSDFIDLSSLVHCDIDQSVYAARKLVPRLYDQKEKLKAGHVDLNKLRVMLATLKDTCSAKHPPCGATFRQHILRASLQTNIWMSAHIPKVSSFIWMGEEESVSFSVFQRSDVVRFFAGSGVYL
jgi:hypothetical protein